MNATPDTSKLVELKGDGTWPFKAYIDGTDIVMFNVVATAFGGDSDPQDNGETASGVNTRQRPLFQGVSLAMDQRGRKEPVSVHKALDGAPVPPLPWFTRVLVTRVNDSMSKVFQLIDDGPGKEATTNKAEPHGIDLTVAAARCFDPKATASNFEMRVNVRILGGAAYAPKA